MLLVGVRNFHQNVNLYILYFIKKSLLGNMVVIHSGIAPYLIADWKTV